MCGNIKAILRLKVYNALYDSSYLGSKTTITTGEWSCLISFSLVPLRCSDGSRWSHIFSFCIFHFFPVALNK